LLLGRRAGAALSARRRLLLRCEPLAHGLDTVQRAATHEGGSRACAGLTPTPQGSLVDADLLGELLFGEVSVEDGSGR
jgi:hypothetical protein